MKDFDSIWRTQDEIRTVVDAVLGECIWNLSYNERRMAIELELTNYLEEEDADMLVNQSRMEQSSCFTCKRGTPISENPRVLF